jgi:hypothetical protein
VSWGDAFIDTEDFDPEEAESVTPVYRKTVGFLIAKNQHGYVLATDTYDHEPEVSAKMFIPHGMITEVTELITRVRKTDADMDNSTI